MQNKYSLLIHPQNKPPKKLLFSKIPDPSNMGTQAERFSEYYENWVTQLESDLPLLFKASHSSEADHRALVGRLTAHHKAYYTTKWAAAHEDVLPFYSPVWLTPLENAYLWMTGWKPSTVFKLVGGLGRVGMREEQAKKVEELKGRIRMEEDKVEREMERQQVAVGDWRVVEGGEGDLKSLHAGLERVMKMADCARLKTLKGILDVLDPIQCVSFLAATSMLHIQLRSFGKKKETDEEKEKAVDTYHDAATTSGMVGNLVIV